MIYKVKITEEALAEVEEAYIWICQGSPVNAVKWRNGLMDVIDSLSQHPTLYGRSLENADLGQEIRELLYGKRRGVYRILFTIKNDVVTVLHVRHGARQPLNPDN